MSTPKPPPARPRRARLPLFMATGAGLIILFGGVLLHRTTAGGEVTALAAAPKGVSVVTASSTTWRPSRRYIGTLEPWLTARVGPQLISAYVDTVLVRPGAAVKRGAVLATLDCRNASAMEKAISLQARALEATQGAISNEAARVAGLLDGGYASPNEVELKQADSASKQAQLLALQAQMLGSSLQVSDCVLRAPFDAEISDRQADPGAFVRPGSTLLTAIDRSTVRVSAEVPEADFDAVAPGTPVRLKLLATSATRDGLIARRAPSADVSTRTIHVELDLPNPDRSLPVGTTVELSLDVGEPKPALELPIASASVRGRRANVFVVEGGVAHARTLDVMGETQGRLFVDPKGLPAGAQVVTLGRTGLREGDAVAAKPDALSQRGATQTAQAEGAKR
ncbi:MAG: efflux RND transporter periplasmic adaptor subunit [Archangiaceae bacterium]|nr:efflux RND transporter periplasmic adaptor subunit [Archangiaceae bacterium]